MSRGERSETAGCVHCRRLIVSHRRFPQVWVHASSRMPRCLNTAEICMATPDDEPLTDEEFWNA